ncbi:MAG TPA: alpha/beta hydrolase [Candidatus Limnocylindrales bacterium]|nr:alpha/beta hydrolase [Candidatus Limnocylindrales bacterium]
MGGTTRGVEVNLVELGEGRPIVMLHGLPGDHRLPLHHLEPVFERRPGWRRIYLDLPGMGGTPLGDIATLDDMLDVVLEAIDHVTGTARFALAGVSFGGHLARGVLARRADRLDGVMLWTPSVWTDGRSRLPPFAVIERDPDAVADVAEDEQVWLSIAVVQTRTTLEAFRAAVKPGVLAADLDGLRRLQRPLALSDANLTLASPFAGPSLVLTGRQDSECGYLDAWDLVEDLPHATFAVLDRAGHAVAEERQPLFRMLVDDWLDRMERAGRPSPG